MQQVTNFSSMVLTTKYPEMKLQGKNWNDIIGILNSYKPRIYHALVYWRPPNKGIFICNTDRANKGNPGESAYGFCYKN